MHVYKWQCIEQMPFNQFVIQFFEDGGMLGTRLGGRFEDGIAFHFNTVDVLVVAITSAVEVSVDKKKLSPSPRSSGSLSMFNSGDIIEGRG